MVGGLKRFLRRIGKVGLLAAGPVVIAAGLFTVYMTSGRFVTTENAYVKAELIIVTAEVSAKVTDVLVADNQTVAAGDVLFRLDQRRLEVERDRRAAELGAARQNVEALKARHRAKLSEQDAAERDAEYLRGELERAETLSARGTISENNVRVARRLLIQADSAVNVAREAIAEVEAELGGTVEIETDSHPDVRRAMAELREAELDLDAAIVRAPRDATVANLSLQAGEYVTEEDPVMVLVATDGFWIEANLKETDLTHLNVGQIARVEVDAYPGVVWDAHVTSLAPATGAEYALLPPQNASGNWVKVVQRVPVMLEIAERHDAPPLRAGMSVAVEIDTGFERPLPEVLSTARAWIHADTL